jgi:hypothetical protein
MTDNIEHDADVLLREWAKEHHTSLRKAGIIDARRERTIREREIDFTPFFASRRRARGHE